MLQNIDCLAHILSYLSVRERESYRAVAYRWHESANELARTQRSLTIIGRRRPESKSAENSFDNFPEYHHHGHHHHRCSSLPCDNRNRNNNNNNQFSNYRNWSIWSKSNRKNDDDDQNGEPNRFVCDACPQQPPQTIQWPHNFIRFQCFCQILSRFPNLRTACFDSIDHWNDHLLAQLVSLCEKITGLHFIRCFGIGRSRMYEKTMCHLNVTIDGWARLIADYGSQLTALTVSNCDLDERQLAIIVAGFRQLRSLDITQNRSIDRAAALVDLTATIESLKIGSRLSDHDYDQNSVINITRPISLESLSRNLPVICGRLRDLHIQGSLSLDVERLPRFDALRQLTIRFETDRSLPMMMIADRCFGAIARMSRLESLEIYRQNNGSKNCGFLPPQNRVQPTACTHAQLAAIFAGCNRLTRIVVHGCDTLDDALVAHARRFAPALELIDLIGSCTESFQSTAATTTITDQALRTFGTFPALRVLRMRNFSRLTDRAIMRLARDCATLRELLVDNCVALDCCDSHTMRLFARQLYCENSNRRLHLMIKPLQSSSSPTQVFCFPNNDDDENELHDIHNHHHHHSNNDRNRNRNAQIRITILGQLDSRSNQRYNRQSSSSSSASTMLPSSSPSPSSLSLLSFFSFALSSAVSSIGSIANQFCHFSISSFTFVSTLLTFGAACCVYLVHLSLLSINSRFAQLPLLSLSQSFDVRRRRRPQQSFPPPSPSPSPPPPPPHPSPAPAPPRLESNSNRLDFEHRFLPPTLSVLGIPFLTPATIALLSSLFIAPCLYLSASFVAICCSPRLSLSPFEMSSLDLRELLDRFVRLYYY